jgi:ubiquinone/menaquinone biosynthesis C-methylase UbiE
MDREVEFVEQSLGVAPGGWILDVACGTGHHAIGLAKRGYQVVGVELSLAMLARCAEEAQASAQKISFLHGDMRELTFVDTYDGAYNIGTSFGYFDDEQNVASIAGIHRALKPKGLFFLETTNRDYVLRDLPSLVWFEGDGCVCMEESSLNPISSRLHVRRTMILNDGTQKTAEYSIRLYALHEIGGILHTAGFRVAEVSGNWSTPGAFFGAESPRIMILAEKRVAGSRSTGSMPTVQIPTVPDAQAVALAPTVPPPSKAPEPPPPEAAPPAAAAAEEEDAPERTWIPPKSVLEAQPTPPPRRVPAPTRPDLPRVLVEDEDENTEPRKKED